jgi:hypothetical protein
MNFKPTLLKSIISIIIFISLYFYQAGSIMCDSSNGCFEAVWINPLSLAIISLIVIYIIWSLIQKK